VFSIEFIDCPSLVIVYMLAIVHWRVFSFF